MKAIRNILSCIVLGLIIQACSQDDFIGESYYNGPSFVRFFVVLDSDSIPLEGGASKNKNASVEAYTHKLIKPIKIPVALTASEVAEEITVDYTTTKTGTFTGYTQTPVDQLSFNPNKLIDTIVIDINERWDNSETNKLDFELISVSDPTVRIGSLNTNVENKTLSVTLGQTETTFTFPSNRMEIEGVKGETFDIEVDFPKGFFVSELESENLFVSNDDFNYTLTRNSIKSGDTQVTYTFSLEEDITNDDVYYESSLILREDLPYLPVGNTIYQIIKPLKVERDKAVNPAAHFYNLNDPYYRTYGETWMDYNEDGICDWQSYNAFTYPVVVEANHPNAVLYTDGGTTDPADDIYHHAFRIGFNSPNVGRTTNSFNLKRWFTNASSNANESPGFNMPEALEFYPTDGTNTSEGTVLVVSQLLTIYSRESDMSYSLAISGEGTYAEISAGVFEIDLELKVDNQELFGGTRVVSYKIYNTNNYADPEPISENCFTPIDL